MKRLLAILLLVAPLTYSQFQIGDRVKVVVAAVNVRNAASTSATILGTQVQGALGTVTGPPVQWGAFPYYPIDYDSGADGFSAAQGPTGPYLQSVVSVPPPSGSLSVTPLPGPVTISFSSQGDTSVVFEGVPMVPYYGNFTVPVEVPSVFKMTLYGPGGYTSYTATTDGGVPLPQTDSLRIAMAAYTKGFQDGALSVGVSSVTVGLSNGKQVVR